MRADPRAGPRAEFAPADPPPRIPFGTADELSCYYDAPAEPCNVHIEVRVPGGLAEPALRRAAAAALAEQPRALARRAPGGGWRSGYAWELPARPDLDPVSVATWAGERDLARERMRFLAAAPPLERSPAVRLLLAAGPGEDRLILNAHHAALDGISCLDLLRAVARHYRPDDRPAAAPSAPAGPAGPASPAAPAAPAPAPSPAAPHASAAPAGGRTARLLRRPAARIAADLAGAPDGGARGSDGYGFELITCEGVPRVARAGPAPHVTVNDLVIAALMLAIGRWNASRGRSRRPVRITMPVNARAPGQPAAAGNLSRLTSVSARPPTAGGDLWPLVAAVAAQTRSAKNRPGPQVEPLSRALAAARCPVAVKRRLLRLALRTAGPLVCDTSLVSNLGVVGDPPRFGAAAASHIWFSTSAHMPRGLSVGAITLGGRLHLCLRYRHALFSGPAAARFGQAYLTALDDITGLADITRPGGAR